MISTSAFLFPTCSRSSSAFFARHSPTSLSWRILGSGPPFAGSQLVSLPGGSSSTCPSSSLSRSSKGSSSTSHILRTHISTPLPPLPLHAPLPLFRASLCRVAARQLAGRVLIPLPIVVVVQVVEGVFIDLAVPIVVDGRQRAVADIEGIQEWVVGEIIVIGERLGELGV